MSLLLINHLISFALLAVVLPFNGAVSYFFRPKYVLNRIFALYMVVISWWAFFSILMIISPSQKLGMFWDQMCLSGAIFIPTVFFHFVASFTRKYKQLKTLVFFNYAFSVFSIVVLWFSNYFVLDVRPRLGMNFFTVPGPYYLIFVIFFMTNIVISIASLWSVAHSKVAPRLCKQASLLFWLSVIGYSGGGCNYLFVYGLDIPWITPVANYGIVLHGFAIPYIIFRHRFLDIEIIIKKTLVFTGLFTMALIIVAGVTVVSQNYLGRFFKVASMFTQTMSIVIAFLLYEPTKKFLVKVTDRYLFQKKEDVRVILNRLSQNIITILDIEKAGTTILETLKDSLRLESGVILIQSEDGKTYEIMDSFGIQKGHEQFPKDGLFIRHFLETDRVLNLEDSEQKEALPTVIREPLELWGAIICIPLFIHHELIGLLMLGKKKSDQDFSEEEIDCFPAVAGQVAIALSNARLYETLKKSQIDFAQQAKMAAIGTLSAGISHEIKNPLNHIRVGTAMLKLNKKHGIYKDYNKEQFEEEVFPVLDIIEENVMRANSVIERLAGFAKKPKEIKAEPVDIRKVLETGLSFLENEFRQHNINIERNFTPNIPVLQADRYMLEDVFLNLLVNARHAIEQDGKISIDGNVRGDELIISIRDSGKGILKENLEKIFDPFFTTKDVTRNTDKNVIKGSGLGLFIVRECIQRMGGRIEVESEVGKGTTFFIIFPSRTWIK